MAAAAETARPTAAPSSLFARSRPSDHYATSYASTATHLDSPAQRNRLRLVTSPSSSSSVSSSSKPPAASHVSSAAASPASSTSHFPPRSDSRAARSKMSSSSIPPTAAAAARSDSRHAKLHKRGNSGSSVTGSSLPTSSGLSHPASPWGDDSASSTPTGSMPKIRPYLRKMSTSQKDDADQGRLDLSKSMSENQALSGLGIHHDMGPRAASDVSFTHATKRSHTRNTSGESQLSTASGSMRPTNKPFVHPMRQTPRPFTPPHGRSFESATAPTPPMDDEERNESDDVLTDDDFRLGAGFRNRRSVSLSSTPALAPTPLSQSHTPFDLGLVPKITSASNASQSNLSLKSNRSSRSRPRGNTQRSFDTPTTNTPPSARTSLDKAFSFAGGSGGRRSDTEPLTRDQRIQAARRKFEEKEERKDRKAEDRLLKRRETEEARRRKSVESQGRRKGGRREMEEVGGAWSTEKSPPRERRAERRDEEEEARPPNKFSVWVKMRVLSCGGKG